MIYIQLFLSFVQIGLFSVGGGYAAIPLIQSQVVETHGWLTMNEFTNLITIAEMTPGPIGCQFCHIYRSADCWIPGALAATFGSFFLPVFWYLFLHLYIVNTKKLQQSAIFFRVCGLPLLH